MNRRIYTDEERVRRQKESQERSRRHNGYYTQRDNHPERVGVRVEGPAWRAIRKLRRSARMCDIAARLWLLDRGYTVSGPIRRAEAIRNNIARVTAKKPFCAPHRGNPKSKQRVVEASGEYRPHVRSGAQNFSTNQQHHE